MSTNTARITKLESAVADLASGQNAILESLATLSALVSGVTPATPAKVTQPKAAKPASTKVYRSAKGKEQAKADVQALWVKTLKDAGVKRAKDLTPAQMEAYRAGSKAIWAAVPKTRSTKA